MKALIQHKDKSGAKMVLQALVPFHSLRDQVLFTNKTNPNSREDDIKLISESNVKYYQRRIDLTRISKIEDFIIEAIKDEKDNVMLATLFPSSMILAINNEDNVITQDIASGTCDIFFKDNIFIVDGQHRMLAMMRTYEKIKEGKIKLPKDDRDYIINYIKDYKFNCTILVNYDLWEQGQVFINVNFKQKPVNKSLYYEIFGSEYRENKSDWSRNQIYIAHCIARELNENSISPYRGMVKMLGTGTGYISQAFIVESLMQNFRKNGIWENTDEKDLMPDYQLQLYKSEILSYFYAIKSLFVDFWPKDGEKATLVCKSTAFGAFVRLLKEICSEDREHIHEELFLCSSENGLCDNYISHIKTSLSPLVTRAEKLFGRNSSFANGSGKGTEVKLFKTMVTYLNNKAPQAGVIDIDDISIQIQTYIWENHIEDLDNIAHHYDVIDMNDFDVVEYKEPGDTQLEIVMSFKISATLYLDSEDDRGFIMDFPAKCTAYFQEHDGSLFLKKDSVKLKVDTDSFYQV